MHRCAQMAIDEVAKTTLCIKVITTKPLVKAPIFLLLRTFDLLIACHSFTPQNVRSYMLLAKSHRHCVSLNCPPNIFSICSTFSLLSLHSTPARHLNQNLTCLRTNIFTCGSTKVKLCYRGIWQVNTIPRTNENR